MNEKTKDFRPFICIDNAGIYPFKDASILLINNAKRTQQIDHNGKTISDLIKGKKSIIMANRTKQFPRRCA